MTTTPHQGPNKCSQQQQPTYEDDRVDVDDGVIR
jgi:hypothetical protein